MIRMLTLLVWCLATAATNAGTQPNPLAALRVFEGRWEGPSEGKPGRGTTSREYRFVLDGHFLYQQDSSSYQPAAAGGAPVRHVDVGYFSFDRGAGRIVWRQFHSEGLVNEYALDSLSADGRELRFVTTRIENLPPGWRAVKVYRVLSSDRIDESFLLGPPGKDLELYTESRLRRVK